MRDSKSHKERTLFERYCDYYYWTYPRSKIAMVNEKWLKEMDKKLKEIAKKS